VHSLGSRGCEDSSTLGEEVGYIYGSYVAVYTEGDWLVDEEGTEISGDVVLEVFSYGSV